MYDVYEAWGGPPHEARGVDNGVGCGVHPMPEGSCGVGGTGSEEIVCIS